MSVASREIVSQVESYGEIVKFSNYSDQGSNNAIKTKRAANIPHRAECIQSLDDIRRIQKFFLSHKRYRDNMMFIIGICTGLRISDICSLNVSDIKNEDGTYKEYIDIIEKKTGKKSANSEDKCYITEAMKKAINLYLSHHKVKDADEPLLYSNKPNQYGEHRIAEESGWRIMKQAQRYLGLDYNLGSHSMRKTFANIAACVGGKSNIDMNKLYQVQHMLKHSDYKTTMRYLNINSFFTSKARNDVSDFVLGKTKYNSLKEALMNNDEDKLDKILEAICSLSESLED